MISLQPPCCFCHSNKRILTCHHLIISACLFFGTRFFRCVSGSSYSIKQTLSAEELIVETSGLNHSLVPYSRSETPFRVKERNAGQVLLIARVRFHHGAVLHRGLFFFVSRREVAEVQTPEGCSQPQFCRNIKKINVKGEMCLKEI